MARILLVTRLSMTSTTKCRMNETDNRRADLNGRTRRTLSVLCGLGPCASEHDSNAFCYFSARRLASGSLSYVRPSTSHRLYSFQPCRGSFRFLCLRAKVRERRCVTARLIQMITDYSSSPTIDRRIQVALQHSNWLYDRDSCQILLLSHIPA